MRAWMTIAILALSPAIFTANPSVYPTGTTIYRPDRAWNGTPCTLRPKGRGWCSST